MGVSIWEGSKAAAVATSLGNVNSRLAVIARALAAGSSGKVESHSMAQAIVRAGNAKLFFAPGDLYKVNKESGVAVSYSGDAITNVTVDDATFIDTVGSAETHGYEFIYDGNVWHMNGTEVELTVYGVTVTGTPAANDVIVVHVQGNAVYFEVLDTDDYDVPTNSALTHTMSLMSRDVVSFGAIPFCGAQLLKVIAEDEYPSGLPAGTYYITLSHGAYNKGTMEDGSYQITTTQTIPVGGGIRHTTMGKSASNYNVAHITGGTWSTFDANGAVLESGLTCTQGTSGTSLGTTTAEEPGYIVGNHLNLTRRQQNGSNYALSSLIRMWLRSDAAGAASGETASWWTKATEFDLPFKSTLPGFLHGIDPDFKAAICPVRKRTALHWFDRTSSATYFDTEETVWQPSKTELAGGTNNSVYECGVKADGTANRTSSYALYKGAPTTDMIKYINGTARAYCTRSGYASNSSVVGAVTATTGEVQFSTAATTLSGTVCGVCIG